MSLDLGTAFVRSRRAVCLAALAPMLASAPVAAQVPTTPTAPTQTPAGTTQTPPPPPSQLPADPNIIRGLEVHAGVGIDEVFTDNARGVASGGQLTVQANNTVTTTPQAKDSDLVTRVTLLLSIVDRTARLEGGLTFQPSFQAYALATDLDRFDNSLLGTASAELWREHFFVESSVSMSSEIINNQAAVTPSATNISNNRADLNSYILTPIYKQAFGTFAIGELRYRIGESSSGAIAPSTNNAVTAMLKNGADVDRLAWTFRLEDSHTDQGNTSNAGQIVNNVAVPVATNSTSRRSGTIDATYAVTRIFSVLGGFGYEEVKNGSLTQIPNRPISDVGIRLTARPGACPVPHHSGSGTQHLALDGRYEPGPP